MRKFGEQVMLTPSDLVSFLDCEHRTHLTLAELDGQMQEPVGDDPAQDMLIRLGQMHEQRVKEELEQAWGAVTDLSSGTGADLEARVARTLKALYQGEGVLYQPTLLSVPWMGTPDFLVRVDEPSKLGPYRYDVVEAKLAYHARTSAVIQATLYALLLTPIQGVDPTIRLYLGDGTTVWQAVNEASAYVRLAQARLMRWITTRPATYPEPVAACDTCIWLAMCDERRRADDHLWYVADITRPQITKLRRAGITTLSGLAHTPMKAVHGIGDETLQRLKHQARLQFRQRETGNLTAELLPLNPQRGLALLPPPSRGDVFFDLEGDPLAEDGSLEYLFGWAEWADNQDEPVFQALWAHTPAQERQSFETFLDHVMDRLARYPDMHIYHYAPYEPTALKRLMGRYATRETAVDRLLRAGILVDLYRIVRQSLRISAESYSIKALEPLYRGKRKGEVTNAGASIVAYDRWKQTQDTRILQTIQDYNRDDCLSTWQLYAWLWQQKQDLRAQGVPVQDPVIADGGAPEGVAADDDEASRLAANLTTLLPSEPQRWDAGQAATWLLAQLLHWHRREDRAEWWRYFENLRLEDGELLESTEALGGLTPLASHENDILFEYPAQEHKIKVGDRPVDPGTGQVAGMVSSLDPAHHRIGIRLSAHAPRPQSLIPAGPVNKQVLKEALRDLAESVRGHGMSGPGPYQALRHLLMRLPPTLSGTAGGQPLRRPGESASDAARRVALSLDHAVLPIQGPPGSGKTFTGAHIIVDLVQAGLRVGITAPSHQVITHLVDGVIAKACSRHVTLRVVQKAPSSQGSRCPEVTVRDQNGPVWRLFDGGSAHVVAGTAWLFARPEWREQLDVLVIDEAGQFSLAQALAAGVSAHSVILLGDPQQLRQPSQGNHPPGVDVSVLQHLLGPQETVPDEAGIFLDVTYRMHPAVTHYISTIAYAGKLQSNASCQTQAFHGDAPWPTAGLVYIPVSHEANRTASPEEAEAIAAVLPALLGRPWTDQAGTTRPLSWSDLLLVAPFNSHVSFLQARFPAARVGTVDKFQGQEAPVVIYSMAASTPEDVPRGMEFLYSLNRLNVAISRAQGLAVLVASPALLTAKPRDPGQLRLVNALCRFVEEARTIRLPASDRHDPMTAV